MNENNQDESTFLLAAIDNYDGYTLVEKSILKILIKIMMNGFVITSPTKLAKFCQVSRASVYLALKKFVKDEIITLSGSKRDKYNKILINKVVIEEIVRRFKIEQHIINN